MAGSSRPLPLAKDNHPAYSAAETKHSCGPSISSLDARDQVRSVLCKHFSADEDSDHRIDAALNEIFDLGVRLETNAVDHASSHPGHVPDATSNGERLRIVLAEDDFRQPRTIDSNNTLVAACLPKRVTKILWKVSTNKGVRIFTMILWVFGVVIAILGATGKVPRWTSWLSLLALPFPVLSFLFVNVDLLKHLSRSFEFYYLMVMIAAAAVAYMVLFDLDERCAILPAIVISAALIVLTDAHHPSNKDKKAVTTTGIIVGILGMVILVVMTHLGVAENLQPRILNISLGGEPMILDVGVFGNRCLTNVCVFFTKNLFNALLHPDCCYLIITARVVHEQTTKSALRDRSRHRRFSVSRIARFTPGSTKAAVTPAK